MSGLPEEIHHAHMQAMSVVEGIVIRLRLTISGTRVEVTNSNRDRALPPGSVMISSRHAELVILAIEWADRWDELDGAVRSWILEAVDLRSTKPRSGRHRRDPWWAAHWRDANPWA
ncbi:hypothetical protein [Brachybacterium hainanense]|uniref:Uncharacterized protein n=1 Tax=Brachybacterium hainanense TaxID=1541174 RepID=A0ABV6RC17_9MICO